jgi:antibiotic biosynthesis monooxygenase
MSFPAAQLASNAEPSQIWTGVEADPGRKQCRGLDHGRWRQSPAVRAHWKRRATLSLSSDPIEPRAKEEFMYAAIRQGKARAGMAEELADRIKEGVIPIVSDVPGFMAYYVVYAPDDTVTAISIFNNVEAAEESNRRALAWIDQNLGPLLTGPVSAVAGPVIVHTLA